MALRLYLSPTEQVGGFAGVPRQTQAFYSSFGPPAGNGLRDDVNYQYREVLASGENIPTFLLTTTKPNGPATILSKSVSAQTRRLAPNTYKNHFAIPAMMGVCRITSPVTVSPEDFVPYNPAHGGVGQWASEFAVTCAIAGADAPYVNVQEYFQLAPRLVYIWRPSTASMVGVLWSNLSQPGSGYAAEWGINGAAYYQAAYPSFRDETVWPTGSYARQYSAVDFMMTYPAENTSYQVGQSYKQSVAALSDDVLVVEWFITATSQISYAFGAGTISYSIGIGGGTDDTMVGARYFGGSSQYPVDAGTPTHNTFIDLPSLTVLTFPIDVPSPAGGPMPKLIEVNPRAGKGLGLVFDNPVGMTGPTLGAPVDGIGLPPGGVTQSDTTHIDIDIDVPPVHPLGEATETTVPVPTGTGAYLL